MRKDSNTPVWVSALSVLVVMQAVSSFAVRAFLVLGPEITAAASAAPQDIGILAGAVSAGTMVFLLSGSLAITYWGPIRILQMGAAVSAVGALAGIPASWWILVVAAFLVGLGYGPSPPAASEILTKTCPRNHLSLAMSVKQAGVPLGGALAGILLPAVTALASWRAALVVTALLLVASAAVVQPWRVGLDADRDTTRPPTLVNMFSGANLFIPFRVLREIPGLLLLTIAVFCFASVQACVLTFFVTQVTMELGFSLAVAGAAFSVMQVSGTVARVAMGWAADRLGSSRTLLLLACASMGMVFALSRMGPEWPSWLVMLVGFCLGVTCISWNGVYLAEAARIAPKDKIRDATSGSTFFAFIAYTLMPFLFALSISAIQSYALCFTAVALVQAVAIPCLAYGLRGNK